MFLTLAKKKRALIPSFFLSFFLLLREIPSSNKTLLRVFDGEEETRFDTISIMTLPRSRRRSLTKRSGRGGRREEEEDLNPFKTTTKEKKEEKTTMTTEEGEEGDDDDFEEEEEEEEKEDDSFAKGGGGAKKTNNASTNNKATTKRITPTAFCGSGGGRTSAKGKKKRERKPPKTTTGTTTTTTTTNFGFAFFGTFLQSDWFQSWLGRVMIYMVVLVVARTLRSVGERGRDGEMRRGFGALKTTKSGGGRMYENYGKSTCDAIRCDFARAQLKRITREAFRGTAVSAFEQIESNAREGSKSSRVVENGGFDGWESEMDSNANNNNNNKPLVLALVSDDQSDFDAILKPGSTLNPFKMAEKKGCFKRLIVNDPYESSLVTMKNKKKKQTSFSLNDPKEIAERRGEVQKELSQFFLECGKKIGGGVVYVRMAKHINVKLLPALLPAFSENGGYTLDGELVPSKDFVFVLEVLKPIIEKSSAFSRERSEYAKALKNGNEATFTRIVKSKLAFYWGVDEEDESLSANALAMRRRVDYVVPVSVANKFDI